MARRNLSVGTGIQPHFLLTLPGKIVANVPMNRPQVVMASDVIARLIAASSFAVILLAPGWTRSFGDTGPAQPGPAEVASPAPATDSQPKQVAHHPPAPPPMQAGMRVERQLLSPSGKLRIEYMRDHQKGIRQIALQDANN